jgi:hypothetical protein
MKTRDACFEQLSHGLPDHAGFTTVIGLPDHAGLTMHQIIVGLANFNR